MTADHRPRSDANETRGLLYNASCKVYTFPVSEAEKKTGNGVRERLRNRPRLRPKVYGYLTEEKESLRQGFAALFLSSAGELLAGIVLAGISGRPDARVGPVGRDPPRLGR